MGFSRYQIMTTPTDRLRVEDLRKIVDMLRADNRRLNRERTEYMKTAQKFGDQVHIAFNFICRQRVCLEEGSFRRRDFLLLSDKVLDDIYERGKEETRIVKRSGLTKRYCRVKFNPIIVEEKYNDKV